MNRSTFPLVWIGRTEYPHETDALKKRARASKVVRPPAILRKFVELFAGTRGLGELPRPLFGQETSTGWVNIPWVMWGAKSPSTSGITQM
ncbi:MAG: hypothetical protein WD602_02215 [Actinomycetota bacterium]